MILLEITQISENVYTNHVSFFVFRLAYRIVPSILIYLMSLKICRERYKFIIATTKTINIVSHK